MDSGELTTATTPRRNHHHLMKKYCGILMACLLAIALQLFFFSPVSYPGLIQLPPHSSNFLHLSNSKLQEVIKVGEGLVEKPEDVAIDKTGIMYTATRDGWIRRYHRNGTWENWWQIDGSDGLLGLTVTASGDLIVCDAEKGLLKVGEEGVSIITSHVKGVKIRFADDVIAASDGTLYFSVASTKFGFHDWKLDLLEANPHGQLLKYDPTSNETSILLDHLGFANGVALSADQDYLVVCESWRFRCLRYWLKGDAQGQTEIFIDNLPGAPDNINLAPDGSFWIALLELIPDNMRYLHSSRELKYMIGAFPNFSKWFIGGLRKAMVVKVSNDGKIMKSFDDPTGKVMSFVTSALEFEQHLYLGSLNCDFIGKLPLV